MVHDRRSSFVLTALLLAIVAAMGWVDYLTGTDLSITLVYLPPIVAAAWWLGTASALGVALVAGVAVMAAEIAGHGIAAIWIWNALTAIVVFIGVAWLVARIRRDRDRMGEMNASLAGLLEAEQQLARTDPLTGLPNSRCFMDMLEQELARSRRTGDPVAVAYVDVDDFKSVNDLFGHLPGDALLRTIGASIGAAIRGGDAVARLGGDEFGLLFRNSSPDAIHAVGERIVASIEQLRQQYPGTMLGVSVGIVHLSRVDRQAEEVVRLADEAMYRAKALGRSRTVLVEG
jgi:diguanylate cyclase (GGDEF)-like protein